MFVAAVLAVSLIGVTAGAQVVVPPGSEVPIPPKPKTDSAGPRPDTIQPPFGRSADPKTSDIGPQYEWNRAELFASGALTVADLLERVPGTSSFRTGWLASPKLVAVNGDLSRVRIYYDGVEMDNIDPRNGGLLDLNLVQVWTLEKVSIERSAGELRVHLRSWSVEGTSPYTRTDVSTGDEDTNIYRGYYGKRFSRGEGLQLAGQQFSTTAARLGGGGDALSFLARAGVSKRKWSVDAFVNRSHHTRAIQPTFGSGLSIPDFDATATLAYLRAGIGTAGAGPWFQLTASSMRLAESSRRATPAEAVTRRVVSDTTDTTSGQNQYVVAGGYLRGPLSISVANRVRAVRGDTYHSPAGRAELGNRFGTVSVFGERNGLSRTNQADVIFRVTPIPAVAIAGSFSRTMPDDTLPSERRPESTAARVEAGVRVIGPWILAGYIRRDTALLSPPSVLDTAYVFDRVGKRAGVYLGVRGSVYKDLGVDIVAMRWDAADSYQPHQQVRSELSLVTNWISRFPGGNFGLKALMLNEYRGRVAFPVAGGTRTAAASSVFSALVEIRIMRATISYQVRNIAGEVYQIVPDFFMPRGLNIYGVRWEFRN